MKKKNKFSIPSKYILGLISIICVSVIVISYATDISAGPLKVVSSYVFVPFQKGINQIGSWFYGKSNDFKNLQDVLAENENLKEQIDKLTSENSKLQLEHYEYERLLNLYKLDEQYSEYDKVAARVIGKDPGNWFNVFIIDKGSNDGLAKNMNVIAGSGLVGIITDVGSNWASVRSIIDDTSNVTSIDLNSSDICTVSGSLQSMNESQTITFHQMSDSDKNAKTGDPIVTSSISDNYLAGILVGYITEIKEDSNNITYSGRITPVVDFEHLEEVLVITKLKEELE